MLLEIITRCYRRPNLLRFNQMSLDALDGDDWMQTLLVDSIGRGVGWSYANMAAFASQLTGEYIWILDDDDCCIYPNLLNDLHKIVDDCQPEVIWIRMDHGGGRILPGNSWNQKPILGDIGVSAFIVRRDIWQMNVNHFQNDYCGDYHFANAIWSNTSKQVWLDIVASRVQRISVGLPEA